MEVEKYLDSIRGADLLCERGEVVQVTGLLVEGTGPRASVGEVCKIKKRDERREMREENEEVKAEVVGFRDRRTLLMPLGSMDGISPGADISSSGRPLSIRIGDGLLGRILDGLGNPIDGRGPILAHEYKTVYNQPPHPLRRSRIRDFLVTGIRAIDGCLTCGKGQRIGIFSGSGIGKSILLGMVARYCSADVNVIALVGERGREVRDFLEKDLGEGLKKSVVVVATSEQPALIRVKASLVATAIAEYFRDKGLDVMLLMDSVTRVAVAQREIGLAVGEPPTTKGFTPSVFAFLPKLLERSGMSDKGSITGFYTILVEQGDMDEPISDSVRAILDGHIVLSRRLADSNHYPAIDILPSISRLMIDVAKPEHYEASKKLRDILSTYRDTEDLINIGAYVKGSNAKVDYAIGKIDKINEFLCQPIGEKAEWEDTVRSVVELAKD